MIAAYFTLIAAAQMAPGTIARDTIAPGNSAAIVANAIAQGQAGEQVDGYLGIVSDDDADPVVRRAVMATNIKRRALYTRLASRQGAVPGEVGLTAGCNLVARVGQGLYYRDADGRWRQRGENRPMLPDYCAGISNAPR